MTDAALVYSPDTMTFDLAIAGYDLVADDGLETAVMVSLFSDRRADDNDTLPGGNDRRGWWGDSYPDVNGDQIGSRLWLLARSKQTQDVLNAAQDYAQECLTWLVEDGIVRSVKATAEILRTGVLALTIEIARAAQPVAKYRFETFWKGN